MIYISVSGRNDIVIHQWNILDLFFNLLSLQFSSFILSFHGNGSPCSRDRQKKSTSSQNCLVEILVSIREDSDSRGEKMAGEKEERFRGVYRVGQEKFVVFLESSHFSHSSCVFLFSIIPTSSLKKCKCCDSGSKGRKLFVCMDFRGEMCNS